MFKKVHVLIFCCWSICPGGILMAQQSADLVHKIELIGVAEISGVATDKSSLRQSLGEGFTNDLLGGFSALEYCGADNLYYLLPDRGPLDGAVDWTCRVQQFAISIQPNVSPAVTMTLLKTIVLKDQAGHPFVGSAASIVANGHHGFRLDPEGIRVGHNGNFFVSDEYGPHIIEFTSDGQFVRQLPMPQRYLIEHPCPVSDDENGVNLVGRQANRGMEGLAISTDGKMLFGLMQSPLLQDSQRRDLASFPSGLNCRLLKMTTTGECQKELLYHLDSNDNKLNEVLAVGEDQFIVIERDGEAGVNAKFKKLMLVSSASTTDISNCEKLPAVDVPANIHALKKSTLIDLLDPRWNLAGETMPEKIEGLAFGPDLPDGRRTLLVGSDNDFVPNSPSWVYVFAIQSDFFQLKSAVKSSFTEDSQTVFRN